MIPNFCHLNESFIHYLWQHQYFNHHNLKTTAGEEVHVFHPGNYNRNAGPDFLESKIKIAEMEWAGSVEIHMKSSDFNHHNHQVDLAYNNVVLHVVWQNDKEVKREDGTIIPTLELRSRVDESLIKEYKKLVNSGFQIPCTNSFSRIKPLTIVSMIEQAAVQRLYSKAMVVQQMYKANTGDWEETFFQVLARNFGFKVNAEAFLSLAKSIPLKTIRKISNDRFKVEALLFGGAGFLESRGGDDYYLHLQKEFNHLARKFDLGNNTMNKAQWKFLRLRPANFPTLRLAQLAGILHESISIFERVIDSTDINAVRKIFDSLPSTYWLTHYSFGKTSKKDHGKVGDDSVDNIIINSVVPTLAAYAIEKDDDRCFNRAQQFLERIKPEMNSIIRVWQNLGVSVTSAFDSQGLIEQMNSNCMRRNCLNCSVGNYLLKPA